MAVIVAAFWGFALNLVATVVGRVLVALSIGVVTYTGLSSSLDWLKSQIVASAAGLPADLLGMMATMKVGASISIIMSAITVRLISQGLTSDKVKRWAIKP